MRSITGSVGRVVIISEDRQMRFQAQSNLRNVRHDVSVGFRGIFTDPTGRMRANWVEVPKRDDVPTLRREMKA